MFTQTELDLLIDAMRSNGVTSLEVDAQDQKLKLDLAPVQSDAAQALTSAPVSARSVSAKSPCIGQFVPRGKDDGLPVLVPASLVEAGETLGYITQRHARALVTAPAAGTLTGDIPPNGAVFGYGDVVFSLEVTL